MNLIPFISPGAWRTACATMSSVVLIGSAGAELKLPAILSSGMVLQQQASVPIWGTAEPGQSVMVIAHFGDAPGIEATVRADDAGYWRVDLSTPKAGGAPGTIHISAGAETLELDDVVTGEVWLCSGQSNMEWRVSQSIEAARMSTELAPEETALEPSGIRHFTVERAIALDPAEDCTGQWVEAAGNDALNCSAAAYYFARRLQEELDVPVGLIVSSWGGTTAQVWTSAEVVSTFPDHARTLTNLRARSGQADLTAAELDAYWNEVDDSAFFARRFKSPEFDDSHWSTAAQPASFTSVGLDSFDGVVWYRTDVDVPANWAGSDLVLELPPIDDHDETFWNGQRIGSLLKPNAWNMPRRYTVPASAVTAGKASLVVRALDTGGGGGFGAGQMRLVNGEEWIDLAGDWRYRKGVSAKNAGRPPMPPSVNNRTPSALYNAMIAPLIPYRIQGFLWYQGESNRTRAKEYGALFPAMIVDWRTRWNDLELPFYFVQIAPYNYGEAEAGPHLIADLRQAQANATRLPSTGMVLTADIGNPRDIHPKNKWEVGRRLALFALRDVYGMEGLEPDGPTARSAMVDGDKMTLAFDHVSGSLSGKAESLDHFELKGTGGDFRPASASISKDGQSIVLQASGIAKPTAARYLWNDTAQSSVAGGTGLPMAPFQIKSSQ